MPDVIYNIHHCHPVFILVVSHHRRPRRASLHIRIPCSSLCAREVDLQSTRLIQNTKPSDPVQTRLLSVFLLQTLHCIWREIYRPWTHPRITFVKCITFLLATIFYDDPDNAAATVWSERKLQSPREDWVEWRCLFIIISIF